MYTGVVDIETVFESQDTFTQRQFEALMARNRDELHRYELIDGRIVVSPSSGWPHLECESNVLVMLATFAKTKGLGKAFGATATMAFPSGDTLIPDAVFISNERCSAAAPHRYGKFLRVVPDLVVEVLSRGSVSRDKGSKRAIYAKNGVREYWIIDVKEQSLTQYVARGRRFGRPRVYRGEDTVVSVALQGLSFEVASIIP